MFFFFQAEDGIRDHCVTGVQTCALPISLIGPACADAGNDTSNFSPADCGAGAACTLAASEKIVADASPTKCLLTINLMPLSPWRRERTTFITGTSRMILGIRKAVDGFLGRCSHGRTIVSLRGKDLPL